MFDFHVYHHGKKTKRLLRALLLQGEKLMGSQEELAAELTAVKETVAKIGDETITLLAKIDELTALVEAGSQVSPEVQAALAALKEQAQVVDDLVPDAE